MKLLSAGPAFTPDPKVHPNVEIGYPLFDVGYVDLPEGLFGNHGVTENTEISS